MLTGDEKITNHLHVKNTKQSAINISLAGIASTTLKREHKGATGDEGLRGLTASYIILLGESWRGAVHVAMRSYKVPQKDASGEGELLCLLTISKERIRSFFCTALKNSPVPQCSSRGPEKMHSGGEVPG